MTRPSQPEQREALRSRLQGTRLRQVRTPSSGKIGCERAATRVTQMFEGVTRAKLGAVRTIEFKKIAVTGDDELSIFPRRERNQMVVVAVTAHRGDVGRCVDERRLVSGSSDGSLGGLAPMSRVTHPCGQYS